ncbi:hypothetical protein C3747_515g6 [Trypanosoma cruzi]|uniref:Uncharacterized protein n=1 Tax=Trypanosoma cruzi TaxID=5693 RepID=A0A2V2US24_TRYCR|nr:hypothetical protein C3747_515g6 [Trypanosoma cruzi]
MRVKKMEMVRRRDAVIADLCLFCLDGPDCGTAFEVAHAAALGKTVPTFAFDWRSMREKYGAACDASVMSVEDFGLSFSLMLCDGAEAFYSFDAALHRFLRHSSECRGCDCGDVREVRVNALGPGGILCTAWRASPTQWPADIPCRVSQQQGRRLAPCGTAESGVCAADCCLFSAFSAAFVCGPEMLSCCPRGGYPFFFCFGCERWHVCWWLCVDLFEKTHSPSTSACVWLE